MEQQRNTLPELRRARGFTLVEMMLSIAILSLMVTFLVSISGQASRMWTRGESDTQYRQRARAALETMGRELSIASLSHSMGATPLQFVINPPTVTTFPNHDTVFWQAPITTDGSDGVAEIGYFVRWNGASACLCRYFVNPSDPNYLIYSSPRGWVTDALLNSNAPATTASHYQGLFLDNVIGMWVTPFQAGGTNYTNTAFNSTNSYGSSSTNTLPANTLPAAVEISLVILDSVSATRFASAGNASAVTNLYGSASNAAAFVSNLPANLRAGVGIATIKVPLDNYKP